MDEACTLQFQKASCVAVGAFNVAIIQPAWLAAKGLLPQGLQIRLQYKLDEPGGFKFTSTELKVSWFVSPTLIILETEDSAEDCGEILARVLGLLPETPLLAIGNNVTFAGPREAVGAEILPGYPVTQPLAEEVVQQRTFAITVEREGTSFNLQLSASPDGIEVLANTHRSLRGEGTGALAQAHARHFFEHRMTSTELIRHYLKVETHV